MNDQDPASVEKTLESRPTLESEINSARINALELKLETLSVITESLWNIIQENNLECSADLKDKMADVIDQRAKRDSIKVNCKACGNEQKASASYCNHCGNKLEYSGDISPFDY
ncbi:hypothetical protein ACMXYV_09275 [Neptuniibacter sp. SY11_33]|uniref:hypothetical protein n=1 Tax=Neptuniibacter sp. SY11_33 TaxID=3398215 RepID=UPI0039F50ADE